VPRRWRLDTLAALAVMATAAGCGGGGGSATSTTPKPPPAPPKPPEPPAALFVDPAGSDAAACSRAAPCRTLARAYAVARPGDVVEVAPGTYPPQQIPHDPARTSPDDVVFRPRAGTRPALGGLEAFGGHFTVRGLRTGFVDLHADDGGHSPADVTVVDGEGPGLFIGGGARDIRIEGGSYGGGVRNETPVKVQGIPAPAHVAFEGVRFHDAVRDRQGVHIECLYAADVQHFTVRRSRFENCAVMDLYLTQLSGVDPAHVRIEDSTFAATGGEASAVAQGFYALVVGRTIGTAKDITIARNRLAQPMLLAAGGYDDVVVRGNVAPQRVCTPGVTYEDNRFSPARC
jgi:hypothetical protein